MGLPSLLLPLETRQVVANIVSHYLFGTRYMYSPFPVCIEGALPDVKGVLSPSLLADYKQEFSRWLSLACSSSDCRTEGCLPFDFFFFCAWVVNTERDSRIRMASDFFIRILVIL